MSIDKYVTSEQFSKQAEEKTRAILRIVAGPKRELPRNEQETAELLADMVAGQAALFAAMDSNVTSLAECGLCDPGFASKFSLMLRAAHVALMAQHAAAARTPSKKDDKPAPTGDNIIPFPSGPKVVH